MPNFPVKQMENKCSTFQRLVINIKIYRKILCILNADKKCTSQNVLRKLEILEKCRKVLTVNWQAVDFNLISRQDTIFRGTLLHVAAAVGNKRIVEALLENGADIEAKCFRGFTPLHYAVRNDQAGVIKVLIDKNTNINAVDLKGCTPLHLAAAKGSPGLVKILLEAGAVVNAADRYYNVPLHFAVSCSPTWETTETVRTLVNFGADVNAKDDRGRTILHILILKKDTEAVLGGLSVKYKEENHRDRFGNIALVNRNRSAEVVMELLLKNGASPNVRSFYGDTVLHCSIKFSSVKLIKLLTRYGADVNERGLMSRAPLYCLCERCPFSKEEISHIAYNFIKRGANVHSTNGNGSPTLLAIIRKNADLAKIVIRWAAGAGHEREKPDYLSNYPDLSKYWDSVSTAVKDELQRLGAELNHKEIFDLMRTTNLNKLEILVNNKNVLSELNLCETYFPMHVHKIVEQYEKGWKRYRLLNMSVKSIIKLYQFSTNGSRLLPEEVAREIALYLTNKEIRLLISIVQDAKSEMCGEMRI